MPWFIQLSKIVLASVLIVTLVVVLSACSKTKYGVVETGSHIGLSETFVKFKGPSGWYTPSLFFLDCSDGQVYAPQSFSVGGASPQPIDTSMINAIYGDFEVTLTFSQPDTSLDNCVMQYETKTYTIPVN